MLLEALEYQRLGWSVIPIRRADKKPALSSWREFQTALATEQDIDGWFMAMPDANVGIVTGHVSGLAVVDFDGYGGSDPAGFLASHSLPTNAPIAITGKGFHVYYRHPGGVVRNGVRLGRLAGVNVDLRGDGGYVVAPPSVHENGRQYHWYQPLTSLREWAFLPAAFLQTVERDEAVTPLHASDVAQANGEMARLMKGIGEGGRNHAAAKLAGFWLKVTNGDEAASLMALEAWNALNSPPLSGRELLTTFRSIAARHIPEPHEPGASAAVMTGREWAAAVRDLPPRRGVANPCLPTLEEVGGIVERDLVLLAGRPGMGKSTVAWGTVDEVSINQQLPTIIFSTEMTAADVARWIGSRRYQVPSRELSPPQWNDTLKAIAGAPLTICDQGSVTANQIVEIVRERPDTKLVIIDHVQRLAGGSGNSRHEQLGATARTLKSLAKDAGCTVLLLSQLNRVGDQGDRPRLSMLRESGTLEEEADAVIFLWSQCDDPTANPLPVEFYLAKNRHGALAQVECLFHKHIKRFIPMDFAAKLASAQQETSHRERLAMMMSEGDV